MNLTIRNIPSELLSVLRDIAKNSRRSLNSEILVRLEKSVSSNPKLNEKAIIKKQVDELRNLSGSWEDERSTEDIIKDIYSYRTMGREIEL